MKSELTDNYYYKKGLAYLNQFHNTSFSMDDFKAGALDDLCDKAIRAFSKAIELYPNSVEIYRARSEAYYEKNDYFHALADCNRVIALTPDNSQSYCKRGHVYREMAGGHPIADELRADYQQESSELHLAMEDFNKAIQLNPNYADAYCGRGWVHYGVATSLFLSVFSDPNSERHIVEKAEREGELAVVDFEKALEFDPDHPSSPTGIQMAQNLFQDLLMNLIAVYVQAQPREDLDEILREMTESI